MTRKATVEAVGVRAAIDWMRDGISCSISTNFNLLVVEIEDD